VKNNQTERVVLFILLPHCKIVNLIIQIGYRPMRLKSKDFVFKLSFVTNVTRRY